MSMCGMRRVGCVAALVLSMTGAGSGIAYAQPTIGSCPVLPADNIWNTPVDGLPVDSSSDAYIATRSMGRK